MRPVENAIAALLAAFVLAGCAAPPAALPTTPEPVFPPNENLLVQGLPAVPQALVDRVQRYTDFRGHSFVDWHPQRREMLVAHRKAGDNLLQLYRVAGPLAAPEQLSFETEPVSDASYEPRDGRYLVFERSIGGNEAAQIFRLDLDAKGLAGKDAVLLTPPDQRHNQIGWLHGSSRLLYSAVPLDRTAAGGTRAEVTTTLWLADPAVDPKKSDARRKVADLPGGGWLGGVVSRDDKSLAIIRYISAAESEAWVIDIASGQRRRVLPLAGEAIKASHYPLAFRPDGSGLYFTSNRAGEFTELMSLDLASGAISRLSAHIPWDISGGSLTRDGQRLAVEANVDGRSELRLFDTASGRELPPPRLPPGSVDSLRFDEQRHELAVAMNSAQGPRQLWSLDRGGRIEQWTRAYAPPGVDMARFGDQQIVRWTSFDGRSISGLLNRPPARFTGKRPVIIDIHGGPERQATVGFMGRYNYLIEELGVAVIQPNVRGSSGFGKTFLSLDNGMKREDSVKDIGALLDWIATQPDLDASRVLVMGGSYGGYMALAVAVHYGERIAGAVDEVGISHFVTFLNNTESYRRDLRRVEYGDERDPAMREFLDRISPLTNAAKIRKPLFVIQGKNDPRVPYTEAEQIVAKVRATGTPVWYLRADNEGHGFVRKENADYRFYAIVKFVETVLLK
jgi:dipeptidyl aminopeptidase/acylaminoacyl peptidase